MGVTARFTISAIRAYRLAQQKAWLPTPNPLSWGKPLLTNLYPLNAQRRLRLGVRSSNGGATNSPNQMILRCGAFCYWSDNRQ
ncbi:hypothetical protein MHK07_08725 [Moraxella nonliquefaciens]|uniref:hypothetical protein n=1 Tax=Moraxella nonliquefaciens TaxID=478 RepID=UPI001EF4582F|nr:hypothetical protein [Moraxella nonliquefaciens]MCG7412576.1 hypothetical protein [Moraxella nonliquefaciens]